MKIIFKLKIFQSLMNNIMNLIHLFLNNKNTILNKIGNSNDAVIKTYRTDNIFYTLPDNKYYKIVGEEEHVLNIGILRNMKLETLNPQEFPSKNDYYIEKFEGNKIYLGANTFAIKNKKYMTIISTDVYEFNKILHEQLP